MRLRSSSADREQHDRRLDDDVAVAHVRQLVREHALHLGGRQREEARGEGDRRRPDAAAGREPERRPSFDDEQAGLHDLRAGGKARDHRVEVWILALRHLTRTEHPHEGAIGHPVRGEAEQKTGEGEDRGQPQAADGVPEEPQQTGDDER